MNVIKTLAHYRLGANEQALLIIYKLHNQEENLKQKCISQIMKDAEVISYNSYGKLKYISIDRAKWRRYVLL